MASPQQFAAQIAPDVIAKCINTGVFPSVVIAQAMKESASGNAPIAKMFNNLFGHMANANWKGRTGKITPTGHSWRWYDSISDAITGHINVLKGARYKLAGVLTAKTPLSQVLAIQKAGFDAGSDKNAYAVSLATYIKKFHLEQYDQQMIAVERSKNENGLAYSEQSATTRTLHNIFS